MTKMRTVLGLSVALNLFLLGAIGGGVAWMNFGPRMIPAGSLRVAGSELPADQRRAFRQALRQARASMNEQLLTARQARAAAAELVKAAELDQAALRVVLEEARNADFKVRSAVEEEALNFVATLSQDDRRRLADAIDARNERMSRRRR
jgi:uncharacterized membrane protein